LLNGSFQLPHLGAWTHAGAELIYYDEHSNRLTGEEFSASLGYRSEEEQKRVEARELQARVERGATSEEAKAAADEKSPKVRHPGEGR